MKLERVNIHSIYKHQKRTRLFTSNFIVILKSLFMKKIFYFFGLITASVIILSHTTLSENGRAGVTGSPGETGCNTSGCHTGVGTSGSVTLTSNIPANGFVAGATYNMTLTVNETGKPLFGMGLEALTSTNDNAGTLAAGANTKILSKTINGISRRNITHQFNGGLTANSAVFTFSWTAPTVTAGDVNFYFAGLAADANGTEDTGDNTYIGSKVFSPQSVVVPITASVTATNVSCFGGTNGSATVTPAGGNAYTYLWSNGQTSQTAANLAMGTYTVTVTSSTQTTTAVAVVTQPNLLAGTISTPSIITCVAPTSAISAGASGGTIPYAYMWSTGASTPSISASSTGNYTVTITDSKGCTSVKMTTVSGSCGACPTLTSAPANINLVNSTCFSNCTVSGGNISAPTTPCPVGSTLQYSVNGGLWSTILPVYSSTVQSIRTRCICDTDAALVSPASVAVVTAPATCVTPSSPTLSIINNVCPSVIGTISASSYGVGTVLEYALSATGTYSTIAPVYTTTPITVFVRCRNTTTNCVSVSVSGTTAPVTCGIACPTLTSTPANVSVVNSTCSLNCTVSGGGISAPTTPCPVGSTLQYSVNGGLWGTTLPVYSSTVQSIQTRCICDTDAAVFSPTSIVVLTAPATCITPSTPTLLIVDNVLPSTKGSISASGCGVGTVLEYASSATGTYSTIAPVYTTTPNTVFVRCRNTITNCVSASVSGTTKPMVASVAVLTLTCPSDIVMTMESGATSIVINYTIPISTSTCTTGGVKLTRTNGLASGSAFPIGTNYICYTATDSCGNSQNCCFKVTVNASPIGLPCDNITVDNSENTISIGGISSPNAGIQVFLLPSYTRVFACFGGNCGTSMNVPNLTAGSYIVRVDLYQMNWKSICSKDMPVIIKGIPTILPCDSITVKGGAQNITISNMPNKIVTVQVFKKTNFEKAFQCFDNCTLPTINISNLMAAEYYVILDIYEKLSGGGWSYLCQRRESVTVSTNFKNPKESIKAVTLSLYPNPANDIVNIDGSAFKGRAVTIEIFNQLGMVVKTLKIQEANDFPISVPLDGIADGFYAIILRSNGEIRTNKLIIKGH
jgi:HYR domain/Secretion system C-terminal sorting domain/SprB repeat